MYRTKSIPCYRYYYNSLRWDDKERTLLHCTAMVSSLIPKTTTRTLPPAMKVLNDYIYQVVPLLSSYVTVLYYNTSASPTHSKVQYNITCRLKSASTYDPSYSTIISL
jgi:hypothetical protein